MAVRKRAKKKTATRKRTAPRKRAAPAKKAKQTSLLTKLALAFILCIGAIVAAYCFGPFSLRAQMERMALESIHLARSPQWMPRPVIQLLNVAYDAIPGSEGLVVEGGEIGHNDSSFIAGIPESKAPVRVLRNQSYTNLFNEKERQSICIAFKISADASNQTTVPNTYFEDPRIQQLRAVDMELGQWIPRPLAPTEALSMAYGEAGANETSLVTNLAPMSDTFYHGIWQELIQEITIHYPQRFDTTWIYLGPVIHKESAKLDSGILVPDAFYAIAFDLSEVGGLRAIAFLLPQNAPNKPLSDCITSISHIEAATGLRFLPEVDYHAREVLGSAVSPQRW